MLPFLLLSLTFVASPAAGSFNLYIDRGEMQRLTGAFSEIHLVTEGVVNTYALNFNMTVPFHVHHLHFKWQATSKRPVHYELVIEFADFFALLQPSANISNVGRLPIKEETIRISLPCSGRLSTEVPVIIRFTFHIKHHKNNLTLVNLKRNKICLFKENEVDHTHNNKPPKATKRPPKQLTSNLNASLHTTNKLPPLDFNFAAEENENPPQQPTPSLLLAGLLGACAVSASVASVVFFICLKRRLKVIDLGKRSDQSSGGSPSNGSNTIPTSSLLLPVKEGPQMEPPPIPINNYVTRFWDELLAVGGNSGGSSKGSDVSPYAYAQVVSRGRSQGWGQSQGHIYANHLSSFYNNGGSEYENYQSNASFGGGSLVQEVDGFQVAKNFGKDQVVERFL